ncbi:hypothetical protein ACIQ6V_24155 [Streptomyces sp. NPDC096198]|uniref:hypothetical protein n=1 Tax=Streptomyces sp. NPDC096198 TaxID=3366080 RepID=UPI00381673C1
MRLSYRLATAALAGLALIGTTAAQSNSFAPAAFASASTDSGLSPEAASLVDKVQELKKQSSVLEGEQAQAWVNRVKAAVDSKEITAHLQAGSSLAFEHATVYAFKDGKTQVAVPISDQVVGASLNAVYDSSGKLLNTLEMQLTHDDKTGHAQVWRNGSLEADKVIQAADLPSVGTQQGPIAARGFSWHKFNSCLSNAGVSSWTLALIATACAGACVGTAGTACVPCITAAGGLGAGTVWFCVGKATS